MRVAQLGIPKVSGTESRRAKFKTVATHLETGEQIIMIGNKQIIEQGFKQGSIARCLSGKRKSHKGYTFKQELRDD